jgi:hypothetical protein
MKNRLFCLSAARNIICVLLILASCNWTRAQQMIHRYSFDEDARDLIGNADGELIGDATIADGAAVLSGNKPSYVDLPNDLVMNLSSTTFETWVTWNGGPVWQRIWDFGNNDNAEDLQGTGTQSNFITPNNGGGMDLSIFPNGIGGQQTIGGPALAIGGLHQIAWTYDAPSKTGVLYVDGAQVGVNNNMTTKLSDLGSTVNDWLGHSQYPDSDFNGSIAEFRIYDGALSAAQVAADFNTGPDPSGRGALVSINLTALPSMRPGGSQQLRVTANFEHVSNLDITTDPGVTYQISDQNVFSVTAGGLLKSLGTGAGTATITANYGGKSAKQDIQVIPPVPPVMIHRYSFTTDASDSVGTANGELAGDANISKGSVILTGNKPSYVNLPNDLFTDLASSTFEIWVTWDGGGPWQRIWDFGNSSAGEDAQGAASASIFLTPNNGGGMQLSIYPTAAVFGQQVLNAAPLSSGKLHHIVWTYDDLATTGVLYLDGAQVAINQNMTSKLSDLGSTENNWLGHSQYVQDADFAGSIAEFRIYNGTLSAADVSKNFDTGPDPTGRGALVSISVVARPIMQAKGSQQVQVKADYENVAGVDITTDPGVVYEVTDPAVLSITSGGLLTSLGSTDETASVKATYQGKTSSQSVHVILPVPPVLLHRYSFTTDVSDSVGEANGTLMGDAAVSNGEVVLSGVKPSYVDLPNELVDGLTDVTFEIWLTWNGGPVWQRIWDFGNSGQGEDLQGAATQSIFLTPNNGGVMDLSIFPNGIGGQQVINGTPLTPNVSHHVVWTYSAAATTARLFVDGAENGSNNNMTYTLADLTPLYNVWLGHSQYIQDADLAANISEFRVYKGTFGDAEVAADLAAGPDVLPSDAASRRLSVSLSNGKILIAWPTTATGFTLESSAKLGTGASWNPVGINPVVNNGQNQVTVDASGTAQFYRLKKQ